MIWLVDFLCGSFCLQFLSLCWTLGINGSTTRGSAKRDLLKQKTDKFQVHALVIFLVRYCFQPYFEKEIACEYHSVKRLFSESQDSVISVVVQVPYLEDPNTGAVMFESHDIVEYLRKTYALPQA